MTAGLWQCPSCGRRFANRNQAHSCGNTTLEELLAKQSPKAATIYAAVESALREAGEFRIHPQKTRIAFITRMSFAGVRFAREWVNMLFIVPRPVDDSRIGRIDLYGPTSFGHHMRLDEVDDVDSMVTAWLAEAKRRGDQVTLDAAAHVPAVVGRALEVLRIPLRAESFESDDRIGLRIPRYAAEALSASRRVSARIRKRDTQGVIVDDGNDHVFLFRPSHELQLAQGSRVDFVLSATVD